jgi:hypothetical protein
MITRSCRGIIIVVAGKMDANSRLPDPVINRLKS